MVLQSRPPVFLLTRPLAQSQRFAAQIADALPGPLRIVISPVIEPQFLQPALPKAEFAGLVFTSETGVAAYSAYAGTSLPKTAWCVGDQTAKAARAAGLQARSADGDVARLAKAILAEGGSGPLLHLHGEDVRGDLAQALAAGGVKFASLAVYRQEVCELSAEARAVLKARDPVVVPLFSPRSANLFLSQYVGIGGRAPLTLVALSVAVTAEIDKNLSAKVILAAQPRADAMLEALRPLIESGSRP